MRALAGAGAHGEVRPMVKNLGKINPVKRGKINNGLSFIDRENRACGYPVVSRVIIFGSSVRSDCSEDSDIDICLVTDYGCENGDYFNIYSNLEIIMDDLCDIFSSRMLSAALREEIIKKGVCVYEYHQDSA